MQINFLDGEYFEDLDLSVLKSFGALRLFQTSDPIPLSERVEGAYILISNGWPINRELLELSTAKYICLSYTGYDGIDLDLCKSYGIQISNIPGYATESVAQMTMLHILNLSNRFYDYLADTRRGDWKASENFTIWKPNTHQLKGKTLGILGYGDIGRRVGELASCWGMQVLPYSLRRDSDFEGFLSCCDMISIHLPLTPETQKLFATREMQMMKDSAFLICTSRGGIIDEDALLEALDKGWIAGAGLDVLAVEPPVGSPLLAHPNCYITPHAGWALQEARQQAITCVSDNIRAYIDGNPINLIGE